MIDRFEITSAKGHSSTSEWSDVIDIGKQTKRLFLLISVTGEDAYKKGEEIRATLFNTVSLEAETIYATLSQLATSISSSDGVFSCIALLFNQDTVVLMVQNGGIILERSGQTKNLLSAKDELLVLQGSFQDSDQFILYNQTSSELFAEVQHILKLGSDLSSAIEQVTPKLYNLETSAAAVIAGIKIMPDRVIPKDELPVANRSTSRRKFRVTIPSISVVRSGLVKLFQAFGEVNNRVKITFSKDTYASRKKIPKRTLFFIFFTILILITAVTVLVISIIRNQRDSSKAETLLQPYEQRLIELEQEADVDPIASRPQVTQVISELSELEAQYETNQTIQTEVQAQKKVAEDLFNAISGKEAVQELPVFYDLRLISPNFVAYKAHAFDTTALFLDQDRKSIVQLNLETKEAVTVPVDESESIRDIIVRENAFLGLGSGVFEKPLEQGSTFSKIIEEGDSNREAMLLGAFDSYIYVFNPDRRNIYRYVQSTESTSDPIGWMQSSRGIDFATVVSMAIDGDIWLTTNTGEVKKLTRGQPVEFEISGLSDPLSSSIQLYTNESTPYVFILEPEKKRVVVLTKTGEFFKEIQSVSLGSATDIVGITAENTVLVVSGSIIYSVLF